MDENIKSGSKWIDADLQEFIVIGLVDTERGTWVYYRTNESQNNTEYSCLVDSFISRFTEVSY